MAAADRRETHGRERKTETPKNRNLCFLQLFDGSLPRRMALSVGFKLWDWKEKVGTPSCPTFPTIPRCIRVLQTKRWTFERLVNHHNQRFIAYNFLRINVVHQNYALNISRVSSESVGKIQALNLASLSHIIQMKSDKKHKISRSAAFAKTVHKWK